MAKLISFLNPPPPTGDGDGDSADDYFSKSSFTVVGLINSSSDDCFLLASGV